MTLNNYFYGGWEMNIYLMVEDGESFCIKSKTMSEAVYICEESYLKDLREERKLSSETYSEKDREYYHKEILQSCSVVGKLKN
jgi:hypothetical protein